MFLLTLKKLIKKLITIIIINFFLILLNAKQKNVNMFISLVINKIK